MDIKLKQRILGIAVLITLFAFCLSMLLQGSQKNQPHIPAINTEPPVSQLTAPNANLNKPAEKPGVSKIASLPSTIPTLEPSKTNTQPAVIAPPVPTAKISVQKTPETPKQTTTPVSLPTPTPSSHQTQTNSQKIIIANPSSAADNTVQTAPKTQLPVKKTSLDSSKEHPHPKNPKNVFSSGASGHYVVQVGAFKESDHAKKLSSQLSKEGYAVDMHKIHTASGELTLVAVGGAGISEEHAEKIRTHLETQLKVTPIIKPIKSKGN